LGIKESLSRLDCGGEISEKRERKTTFTSVCGEFQWNRRRGAAGRRKGKGKGIDYHLSSGRRLYRGIKKKIGLLGVGVGMKKVGSEPQRSTIVKKTIL